MIVIGANTKVETRRKNMSRRLTDFSAPDVGGNSPSGHIKNQEISYKSQGEDDPRALATA
jgi:hypothetical protein